MVKNTQGGSSHKSMARKQVNNTGRGDKLRLATDTLECYAMVTKMLGNGMCQVLCQDAAAIKTMVCFIRGKFRCRNKKNNMVVSGSLVLVGIRDFESANDKCDLLEVYDEEGQRLLRNHPSVNLARLDATTTKNTLPVDDVVDFSNDVMLDLSNDVFVTTAGETVHLDEI